MKTKALILVIAFMGVAAGGLLMWAGDKNQSASFQRAASVSSSSSSSTASTSSIASTSSPNAQIHASNDVPKRTPEAEAEAAPSDLAAQLSMETQPLGPADACVEMARTVMCPLMGEIPFVREMVGQIAIWGQFSCPTGT